VSATRLLVVGGGIGGYTAALRAAKAGLGVVLVERGPLGGTCLNVGCIPTKSLLHQGRAWREALALVGAAAPDVRLAPDFAAVGARRDAAVARLVAGVQALVRRHRVRHVAGTARFVDARRVRVSGPAIDETIAFDACVIATGSRPVVPPIAGADLPGVIDSDAAVALAAPPRRLVVVGAGVLGMEFAQVFDDFGSRVTVVEQRDRPLADEDPEVGTALRASFEARGIAFVLGAGVGRIARAGDALRVEVGAGHGARTLEADAVLLAAGRRPATEGLGLEAAGVRTERGAVVTDARCRTGVPGLWAVGDVRGGEMLAHRAAADAECAIADLLGRHTPRGAQAIPRAAYTSPAVGAVGLTEAQARLACGAVRIGRFPLSASGKAIADDADEGFVKVIADGGSGQVLGVAMVGSGVTELLGEATLAVQMELTLEALAQTVHPHPTLSEALAEAAHDAHDHGAIHLPPRAGASPSPAPA
jgi:dihydrolipoamide dehydrogenase